MGNILSLTLILTCKVNDYLQFILLFSPPLQDIADAAYKRSRGRPLTMPGLGNMIADMLFSLLLQSLFLIQGVLANLLPLPGIG